MTKQLSLAVLAVTLVCLCSRAGIADDHSSDYEVTSVGRTSVGVFEPTSGRLVRTLWSGERVPLGRHSIAWDGLDHRGEPVPAGKYEWRVVTVPGFTARYVTTIGINPPGGESRAIDPQRIPTERLFVR